MSRRIAIVSDAAGYVGPALARLLATRGHDLVVGDPAAGLVDELTGLGATVEVVDGVRDLSNPDSSTRLVQAALDRFGRIDSATAFTGRIVVGRFLRSTIDDLRAATVGCIEAPYNFLRAVVPPMVEQGDGQVLVFTSAAGARPTPGAAVLVGAGRRQHARAQRRRRGRGQGRAGQRRRHELHGLSRVPARQPSGGRRGRARVEAMVPMGRLGTLDELAHFSAPFVDGTSRFTTGQFVAYAGGWV